MTRTAALESRITESQKAPDSVPDSVPDPVPVPVPVPVRDAGPSPPSEATCTVQQRSDAASGEVSGGASTAAAGLSDGASGGGSSGASVTAASKAPDEPRPLEPPRVPHEGPSRGSDGATGKSEAPGATNFHSSPSSGMEKASWGRHPTVAPAPETGTSGC